MDKTHLKKKSNLNNLKSKQYRQINFLKNSIILRKNQSFRHVYLLKSGEAAIFNENYPTQPLLKYKQGDYLNSIQLCMGVTSFKTIKAITKCDIILIIWNKQRQDHQKKNVFIPKIQSLKFYEVPIFKSLSYALMLQLVMHFRKEVLSKTQITNFLKGKSTHTCFVISGTLTLESISKQKQDILKYNQKYHIRQQRKSVLQQNNLRLLKFEAGEMLYIDSEHKYQYVCELQKCEIIYIPSDLLFYFLSPQYTERIKQLKEFQSSNIKYRRSKTFNALKKMSHSINRQNSRSQFVPEKFQNKVQKKVQKFEKAKSVHYTKNNRNFRSYSEQKKRILQERDEGYRKISELNRRKYGRNYIYEKRLEISRNIHGDNIFPNKDAIKTSDSESVFRRGFTVYESVTLKDDYGIIKKSPLMKFIRRNKLNESKSKKISETSPVRLSKNEKEIENLTLKSVQKIRKTFQSSSKTLLKNRQKVQMQLQL